MASLHHQLQSVLLAGGGGTAHAKRAGRAKRLCCPAIAIDAPASSDAAEVAAVRWGSTKLQGRRSEMEDDFVIRTDGLDGFSFAAVLDGHAGFSSVQFLKDELYKACATALQEGLLLSKRDFSAIQSAILGAFADVDAKLLHWLEMENEDESGSTATAIFLGNDILIVSHVGDSCVVLSRSGKAEVLTSSHRPYGNNKASLSEIRRIREAGGWIANGRICGDISVSRAFGDIRFKTKKNEMLKKGVAEGKWTEKFISRVNFTGDLVTSTPDVFQVALGPDVEFLLLASDGLLDYMNRSDAVEFVRNQLSEHGNVQRACEALAATALDRGSEDNLTIVIADLGRTDWKNITTQDANIFLEISQAIVTVAAVSVGIWISSFLIS